MANKNANFFSENIVCLTHLQRENLVSFIEKALIAYANERLQEAIDIVDDELGGESDRDDERGHMQSMHLGAMDALRTVSERLKTLKEDVK